MDAELELKRRSLDVDGVVVKRFLVSLTVALVGLGGAGAIGPAAASAQSPSASDFVIGVVPQQELGRGDMQLMRSGSIESFRLFINWSEVERVPGLYDWSASDAAVAVAAAEGITTLPFLYGSPTWAAALDGRQCSGAGCVPFAPSSDLTRASFARFAAAAVARYGPQGTFWVTHPELPPTPIRSWQVWLEQNSPTYFAPTPDVRSYAELLEVAAEAIRGADPGAEVVLGGMWGADSAGDAVVPAARYLKRLYRRPGAKANFDSIALHPYARKLSGVFEQIKAGRAAAKKARDRKVGLWVTELGWASSGPKKENLVYGPRKQARLLKRAFASLHRKRRAWRVRGVYWYAWRDTPTADAICVWCPGAGLFALDGTPKPAWNALTTLASRIR
ncbi:MAG: hypothetical protein ACRDLO_12805 [Solirubrobacterales bacterium]